MIEIAAIDTSDGLDALRSEWQELWHRDTAATPFQSPAWQFAWWQSFGSGEPMLLTARLAGRLVGLLPLYLLREDAACKLLPIGVGLSDYIDALIDPAAPDTTRHFLDAVARLPDWTELWLPDLAPQGHIAKISRSEASIVAAENTGREAIALSPVSGLFSMGQATVPAPHPPRPSGRVPPSPRGRGERVGPRTTARQGQRSGGRGRHGASTSSAATLTIVQAPAAPCPMLPLTGSLADIVPRKTLRDLHQARSRAASQGGVTIAAVETSGLAQAMDELFRLHERRWRERGEAGVCADAAVQCFHRAAAAALRQAGMLRLYRLNLAGRVAAIYYGFAAKGCMYAYVGGFDPALPRLSPGAQIIGHAIEAACAEGLDRFDFLRGAEAYKYAWGAVDQPKLSLRLTRP